MLSRSAWSLWSCTTGYFSWFTESCTPKLPRSFVTAFVANDHRWFLYVPLKKNSPRKRGRHADLAWKKDAERERVSKRNLIIFCLLSCDFLNLLGTLNTCFESTDDTDVVWMGGPMPGFF